MVEHGLVLGEVVAQSDARQPRQWLRSGQVVSAPMRSGARTAPGGGARTSTFSRLQRDRLEPWGAKEDVGIRSARLRARASGDASPHREARLVWS